MFTEPTFDAIKPLSVAGVILLHEPSGPSAGYSGDSVSPQAELDLHGAEDFAWNPPGSDLWRRNFPFAIVAAAPAENTIVTQRAADNERSAAAGDFLEHAAQFRFRMFANTNSIECLKQATCMPVGGYSVWGGLLPVSRAPVVLAVARTDSAGFFHDLTPAADSAASGTAALMAAAQALSTVPKVLHGLPRQVVFALFSGESWGYAGSRKLVEDIQHFACKQWADPSRPEAGCNRPYAPSVAFMNVSLARVHRLLELSQVAGNDTVFLHREHDGSGGTDAFAQDVSDLASDVAGLSVLAAAADTPGVPPGSAQAFLYQEPAIPTLVFTDHRREFSNKFYHSQFDSARAYPASSVADRLCRAATLTARTLLLSAGATHAQARNVSANCQFVESLYRCLTEDFSCELVQEYLPIAKRDPPTPPSKYAGVFQLALRRYLGGMPRVLHSMLTEMAANVTAQLNATDTDAAQSSIFFHDAVDPELQFDYDTSSWSVRNASRSPIWTESNWGTEVGVRVYRTEDPAAAGLMLGLGIAVTLVGAVVVHFALRYCRPRFKGGA